MCATPLAFFFLRPVSERWYLVVTTIFVSFFSAVFRYSDGTFCFDFLSLGEEKFSRVVIKMLVQDKGAGEE